MKTKAIRLTCLLSTLLALANFARAQGTAFTYQGRLNDGANPAGATYDLRFAIYDALNAGTQQGSPLTNSAIIVSNGLFTVKLDFGNQFTGANRWLEIGVRTNGGGAFATLNPRQALTASPYAVLAAHVPDNSIGSSNLQDGAIVAAKIANSAVGASQIARPSVGSTHIIDDAISSRHIVDGSITASDLALNLFWSTTGNSGTTPGTHFLGTTDNQPLELKVNNHRGLRLEPTSSPNAVNVIGGSALNYVGAGAVGATIGGGGGELFGFPNVNYVEADFGTVSGGQQNTIQFFAGAATIGGGFSNTIHSSSFRGTIAGGGVNEIQHASYATIGGGLQNIVQANANFATIGGGQQNTIQDNAQFTTISGGRENIIQLNTSYSTLSGGRENIIQLNASYSTLSGGIGNTIQTNSDSATIGGGQQNKIKTNTFAATIGGGFANKIEPNADSATIGGGYANIIQINSGYSTIGGGNGNAIQPNTSFATIPGGRENSAANSAFAAGTRAKANHTGAFVWADSTDADFASTANNQFLIRAGGGVGLGTASPAADLHISGPDTRLRVQATDSLSYAVTEYVTDGRTYHTGAGGSAAGGGLNGKYYIYDETLGATRLVLDTSGNVGIGTTAPVSALQVVGTVTATAFNPPSDRNLKENFAPVSSREVLEKVAALPISRWNFKGDAATPHVGPMAQDFYAAFGTGTDERHIATVDADGVALAAIQGLNQKVEEQRAALKSKEVRIAELEKRLAAIEALLQK